MESTIEITIDDIKEVGKECSFIEPNQDQINYVINNYNEQSKIDPSGYWRLWVEQLLYDTDVEKQKK